MPTIRFTHTGSSAVFGNFSAGDELTCGAEAAEHFVTQARAAEYVQRGQPAQAPVDQAATADKTTDPQPRTRRRGAT